MSQNEKVKKFIHEVILFGSEGLHYLLLHNKESLNAPLDKQEALISYYYFQNIVKSYKLGKESVADKINKLIAYNLITDYEKLIEIAYSISCSFYKNYLHITKEEERNVFIDFVKNNSNEEIRKRIGAVFREAITKYMNEINRIIKEDFNEMKVDNTNAELLFPPIPYKHEEGFTEEEKRDFIGHFLNFTMAGVINTFKFVKECRNYDSLKKPLKAHLKAINYYYKRCLDIYEKQEKKETVEYIDKIVSYNLTGVILIQ